MKLIVGLCNPEEKYILTRHNAGKMIVDSFVKRFDLGSPTERYLGAFWSNEQLIFLEPHTGMNSSGESVKQVVEHYSISSQDILVISDDVDLPFGKIRLRASGSSGRHKGLDSIFTSLGTSDISRLKIGVGPKKEGYSLIEWVLGKFEPEEQTLFPKLEEAAWDILNIWLTKGTEAAMSEANGKVVFNKR